VDALLRSYHGLRFRGDGSGYKLPWDVRLRMPQRPGEKRANVDIARVKSAEEASLRRRRRRRLAPGPTQPRSAPAPAV
jgi:hypothetical protein